MDTPQILLLRRVSPFLRVLTLSASTVAEDATASTVVGALIGRKPGSTLSLLSQSQTGWFALSGTNIIVAGTLDYETTASPTVTIRETFPGPYQRDTVLTITVTDVSEGPVFGSEVWPQPAFDASTNLSLQNASVTGGELVFTSGAGAMLCLGLLNGADTMVVGQTWRVSGECTEFNVGSVINVRLGCAANTTGGTLVEAAVTATAPFSFDVELTTVTTQRAVINDITDAAGSKFTSFSIKRVISP